MNLWLRQRLPDSVKNGTRNLRRRIVQQRVQLRALSRRERQMPAFLIIGAMKAGTTSLFRYLCGHPQINSPIVKEIDYFNFNWSRSTNWYAAHFSAATDLNPGMITGEASAGYLVHPRAASRAQECIPDARIIVLLRDPVTRSLSQYFHQRRIGLEERPIDEALFSPVAHTTFDLPADQELAWHSALNSGARPSASAARLLASCPMHHAYVTGSRYADHLPAWLDQYGRDRVLILRSEDLFREPQRQFSKTLEFLNLDIITPNNMPAHNIGKYSQTVAAEILAKLRDEFAEPNRRLYTLLGDDFGWSD